MPHIMLWLGLCCAATCAYDCLSYEDELLEMRFWLINLLCALAARSLSHESLTVSMRLIYVYEGIRWLLLAPFCVCCHLLHLHNALRIGYAISRMKETLLSVRLIYDCLFWFKMMLRFCTDRKRAWLTQMSLTSHRHRLIREPIKLLLPVVQRLVPCV